MDYRFCKYKNYFLIKNKGFFNIFFWLHIIDFLYYYLNNKKIIKNSFKIIKIINNNIL